MIDMDTLHQTKNTYALHLCVDRSLYMPRGMVIAYRPKAVRGVALTICIDGVEKQPISDDSRWGPRLSISAAVD